jgi:hypothetical protein
MRLVGGESLRLFTTVKGRRGLGISDLVLTVINLSRRSGAAAPRLPPKPGPMIRARSQQCPDLTCLSVTSKTRCPSSS